MATIDLSDYRPKPKKAVKKEVTEGAFDLLSKDISFGDGQLPDKKKESFYNELGTLIRSGIDIKTALDLTASSFTSKKDASLFATIEKSVIAGKSLSETLQGNAKFSQ